jgi:hypothetical protein
LKFIKLIKNLWNFLNFEFFENFEFLFEIFEIFWNSEFFENFDLFCNLIGRLEMKYRLWLDNVETPNRQETKIDTSPNIPHARCTHCTRGILTAREVYSLWGRVEKMLFRPISEKQNSLSFDNVRYCYFSYS